MSFSEYFRKNDNVYGSYQNTGIVTEKNMPGQSKISNPATTQTPRNLDMYGTQQTIDFATQPITKNYSNMEVVNRLSEQLENPNPAETAKLMNSVVSGNMANQLMNPGTAQAGTSARITGPAPTQTYDGGNPPISMPFAQAPQLQPQTLLDTQTSPSQEADRRAENPMGPGFYLMDRQSGARANAGPYPLRNFVANNCNGEGETRRSTTNICQGAPRRTYYAKYTDQFLKGTMNASVAKFNSSVAPQMISETPNGQPLTNVAPQ